METIGKLCDHGAIDRHALGHSRVWGYRYGFWLVFGITQTPSILRSYTP